jgi:hypothetical protein
MKAEDRHMRWVGWIRNIDEIGVRRAGLTTEHKMQSRVLPNTRMRFTSREIGVDIQCRPCSDHNPSVEITRDTSLTASSSRSWLPRCIDWGVPGPMGGRPDAYTLGKDGAVAEVGLELGPVSPIEFVGESGGG